MIANDIDQPNTLFPRLNVNNVPQEPSTECCSQQRNGAAVHTIHLGVSQGSHLPGFLGQVSNCTASRFM